MIKLNLNLLKRGCFNTVCSMFVFLFVYAAMSKFREFEKFHNQIQQSPLLAAHSELFSHGVLLLELIIACLLLNDKLKSYALLGSFSLMVIFSAYIIAITKYSEFVPCSCGGILEKMSWNQHLYFNVFFVIIAAVAFLIDDLELKTTR